MYVADSGRSATGATSRAASAGSGSDSLTGAGSGSNSCTRASSGGVEAQYVSRLKKFSPDGELLSSLL